MTEPINLHPIGGNNIPNLLANPPMNNMNVGGNQPVNGVNNGGIGIAPQQAQQNVQTNAKTEASKALIQQLDILLMRAAENATKSVDAVAVKAALEKVNLSENMRKAIGEAADKAESAFNVLNAFTGRELGEVVKAENGVFEWDNTKPASVAINKAINAQADLADMLRKAINETHNKETAALLAEADWAHYDREEVNNFEVPMDDRVEQIPLACRFKGTVDLVFHLHEADAHA